MHEVHATSWLSAWCPVVQEAVTSDASIFLHCIQTRMSDAPCVEFLLLLHSKAIHSCSNFSPD